MLYLVKEGQEKPTEITVNGEQTTFAEFAAMLVRNGWMDMDKDGNLVPPTGAMPEAVEKESDGD